MLFTGLSVLSCEVETNMMQSQRNGASSRSFRPKFLRAIGAVCCLGLAIEFLFRLKFNEPLVHYEAHYNTDRKGAAAEIQTRRFRRRRIGDFGRGTCRDRERCASAPAEGSAQYGERFERRRSPPHRS